MSNRRHKRKLALTQPAPVSPARAGGYDRPLGPDLKEFNTLMVIAISVVFCIAAGAMSINNFIGMWTAPVSTMDTVIFVVRILLFIELITVVFRWFIATQNELRLWLRYLDNPLPRESVKGALFGLAVFLGISVSFPHQIVFLTGFMGASFLLNYWTQWLSNDHFRQALIRTRQISGLTDKDRRILAVLETYWLEKPQLARNTTIMFFVLVAFAFAFAGSFQGQPNRNLFQLIAYALLIMVIFFGEVTINWWRRTRDRDIATIVAAA